MKIIPAPLRDQASVLVISLVTAVIIGIVLGSYLFLIHTQNLSVARSQAWNTALAIAEAGVEEALAELNPGITNKPRFGVPGWNLSNGYWVLATNRTLANGFYGVKFTATNFPTIYSTGYTRAPISGQLISRVVEVQTGAQRLFPVGMAARLTVDLNGNNISIDSYDSSMTNLFPGGLWNAANRRDNGDVASAAVQNTANFTIANANIRGRVRTGPGTVPTIGPNGSVGDNGWVGGGSTGIKPGWWMDDFNMDFPDVLPPFSSGAALSSGTTGGTNYTYLLGTGDYMVNGTLTVANNQVLAVAPGENAVLYVTGNLDLKNGSVVYIAPNATLKVFVGGASGSMYMINTTGDANAFQYYGLPGNTSLTWSGNQTYVGTVYAPNADFVLGGGGNNNYDYQGATVVKNVRMNGHFNVHYDENLGRRGPLGTLAMTSWREL